MSEWAWFALGYVMALMTVAGGVGVYQWRRYRT